VTIVGSMRISDTYGSWVGEVGNVIGKLLVVNILGNRKEEYELRFIAEQVRKKKGKVCLNWQKLWCQSNKNMECFTKLV
jgi:hypothetical protein